MTAKAHQATSVSVVGRNYKPFIINSITNIINNTVINIGNINVTSFIRGVRLAKNDFGSVFGSVLQKNCGFRFGFTKLTEMTYFRAELVQLIVSRSDSELEVQRYGMNKNTLTVDPMMLQDEL